MQARSFCVVADLDSGGGEAVQFLDGFDIGRAHIRGRDDAKLAAPLRERAQVVDDQAKATPLDK